MKEEDMFNLAKLIPLTLLTILMTGCLNQEVDPMECFQHSPEDCLTKSEPKTCHNVPIEGWLRVYNIERGCNEYYSGSGQAFVCAPLDYDTFFTAGFGEQVGQAVSPDGRIFVSPTIGNAWHGCDYEAPYVAPDQLQRSEDKPMCNPNDEHPNDRWQRIQERELAEADE